MDVKGVSNRTTEPTVRAAAAGRIRNADGTAPLKDTVSTHQDWKIRVISIDNEIKALQESVTVNQLKRDGLTDLQMELMDIPHMETDKAGEIVDKAISATTFNGEELLSEFRFKPGTSYYDYVAGLETEKNRLFDTINDNTRALKAHMSEKENILFVGNNIDPGEVRGQRISDIENMLSSISKGLKDSTLASKPV